MLNQWKLARGGRRVVLLLAVVLAVLSVAGCSNDGDGDRPDSADERDSAIGDPATRGPYAFGRMRITWERIADNGETRVLDTWIWYPASGDAGAPVADDVDPATEGGPFPVVIFSHGSGGRPQQSQFFTEHLASWGYVVAAPPHPGNTTDDCFPCGTDSILASAAQRPDDVTFILDQVLALRDDASSPIGGIIDPERTALAGHSFGGWTAIYSAPSGRFDAVIAMAPGAPQLLAGLAKRVTIPVQIFESSKDQIIPAAGVQKLGGSFPPETTVSYITLPEARHLAYADRCLDCGKLLTAERVQSLINGYALAFLQRYVRGDETFAAYLDTSTEPDALVGRPAATVE